MKRIAIVGAIILLLTVSLTAYYHYNNLRRDISTQHTDVTIKASQLYQQYYEHEQEANQKYLDKVIEVKGRVSKVQSNNGLIVLLLNAGDGMGGINCSMKESNSINVAQELLNKEVLVKGKCTGFLMDVNLVDCIIIQPEKN